MGAGESREEKKLEGLPLVKNKYRMISVLGAGNFSAVYKVQHKKSKKVYAMKVVPVDSVGANANQQKVVYQTALTEKKMLKMLKHENIVRMFDSFVVPRNPAAKKPKKKQKGKKSRFFCILIEYIHGDSLEAVLKKIELSKAKEKERGKNIDHTGKLSKSKQKELKKQNELDELNKISIPKDICLQWFVKLLETVHYVHSKKIIHCDLHPENVLLGFQNMKEDYKRIEIKLSDFGVAKDTKKELPRDLCGQIFYAAPEAVSQQQYDSRADMWSLGIIFLQVYAQLSMEGYIKFIQKIFMKIKTVPQLRDKFCERYKIKNIMAVHNVPWITMINFMHERRLFQGVIEEFIDDQGVRNVLSQMMCPYEERLYAKDLVLSKEIQTWKYLMDREGQEKVLDFDLTALITIMKLPDPFLFTRCLQVLKCGGVFNDDLYLFILNGGVEVMLRRMKSLKEMWKRRYLKDIINVLMKIMIFLSHPENRNTTHLDIRTGRVVVNYPELYGYVVSDLSTYFRKYKILPTLEKLMMFQNNDSLYLFTNLLLKSSKSLAILFFLQSKTENQKNGNLRNLLMKLKKRNYIYVLNLISSVLYHPNSSDSKDIDKKIGYSKNFKFDELQMDLILDLIFKNNQIYSLKKFSYAFLKNLRYPMKKIVFSKVLKNLFVKLKEYVDSVKPPKEAKKKSKKKTKKKKEKEESDSDSESESSESESEEEESEEEEPNEETEEEKYVIELLSSIIFFTQNFDYEKHEVKKSMMLSMGILDPKNEKFKGNKTFFGLNRNRKMKKKIQFELGKGCKTLHKKVYIAGAATFTSSRTQAYPGVRGKGTASPKSPKSKKAKKETKKLEEMKEMKDLKYRDYHFLEFKIADNLKNKPIELITKEGVVLITELYPPTLSKKKKSKLSKSAVPKSSSSKTEELEQEADNIILSYFEAEVLDGGINDSFLIGYHVTEQKPCEIIYDLKNGVCGVIEQQSSLSSVKTKGKGKEQQNFRQIELFPELVVKNLAKVNYDNDSKIRAETGDVIGCGFTLSGKVFLTKNNKIIKHSMIQFFPPGIKRYGPKPVPLKPSIKFINDNVGLKLKVNFGVNFKKGEFTPFKFKFGNFVSCFNDEDNKKAMFPGTKSVGKGKGKGGKGKKKFSSNSNNNNKDNDGLEDEEDEDDLYSINKNAINCIKHEADPKFKILGKLESHGIFKKNEFIMELTKKIKNFEKEYEYWVSKYDKIYSEKEKFDEEKFKNRCKVLSVEEIENLESIHEELKEIYFDECSLERGMRSEFENSMEYKKDFSLKSVKGSSVSKNLIKSKYKEMENEYNIKMGKNESGERQKSIKDPKLEEIRRLEEERRKKRNSVADFFQNNFFGSKERVGGLQSMFAMNMFDAEITEEEKKEKEGKSKLEEEEEEIEGEGENEEKEIEKKKEKKVEEKKEESKEVEKKVKKEEKKIEEKKEKKVKEKKEIAKKVEKKVKKEAKKEEKMEEEEKKEEKKEEITEPKIEEEKKEEEIKEKKEEKNEKKVEEKKEEEIKEKKEEKKEEKMEEGEKKEEKVEEKKEEEIKEKKEEKKEVVAEEKKEEEKKEESEDESSSSSEEEKDGKKRKKEESESESESESEESSSSEEEESDD